MAAKQDDKAHNDFIKVTFDKDSGEPGFVNRSSESESREYGDGHLGQNMRSMNAFFKTENVID